MSNITAASGAAAFPAAQPATARGPKSTLGQGDFLRLLTAQLQNQDPTKPVDNMQYVQQMASFSQVAGTSETNVKLTAVIERLDRLIARSTTSPASN